MSNGASSGIVEAFKAAAAHCPLTPAIELIGEKWTILILRGSVSGIRHFEEFQAALGIARNILSNRLGRLVDSGVLQRSPDSADRRRVVYTLTEKGRDLLPTLVALRQWSEKWVTGPPRVVLADKTTGEQLRPIVVCAQDGRIVGPDDLTWIDTRPERTGGGSSRSVAATTLGADYS